MYGFWDMECNIQNFFSFWTIFTLLPPPLPLPNNLSKSKFQKKWKKKTPGDIIILLICTINEYYSMSGSWDMEHNWQNCFSFWVIFCPFTPLTTKKIKILKKTKKKPGDTSFYTSATKIMIICYTVLEIWHLTDVIVIFHIGQFFAILPP